ncbi:hypothetical protein N2152v2_010948 [Parachlorella kessleri]
MTSGHQTAGFTDLPGDLIARIAADLTPKDRARLLCCTRQLWQLSFSLCGLWEELEFRLSLQEAQALSPFLPRRRHLVHSLNLWLLDFQPRTAMDSGEVLRQLVHSLADGALRKLSASLGRCNLTLGSWLVPLPHLSELSISGTMIPVTLAASLSRLTTLTSLYIEACAPVLPEHCLPTSLRSLTLSVHCAGRLCLPAAVAAATALEQLTVMENTLEDAQGLQRLQNLTSLTIGFGESGVPVQVAELVALRSLKVHAEEVQAEQLALLAQLTNLTSLTFAPVDGGYAGFILAPLPSELLSLPYLLEMRIHASIPPLGVSGPGPVSPSLQNLDVSIAVFAPSPAALASLTSLTYLHLNGLFNEEDCPPLATASVTTLMLTLSTLPRLASLAWTASFPLEGAAAARLAQAPAPAGGAAAVPGHAGAAHAQQDPQQPNQQQHAAAPQAAAPQQLPSAANAPDWPGLILRGFPSLTYLNLDLGDPQDHWVNIVGAEQLVPWLALPGWLGCMRGLKKASLLGGGKMKGVLREALPPGVALQSWY